MLGTNNQAYCAHLYVKKKFTVGNLVLVLLKNYDNMMISFEIRSVKLLSGLTYFDDDDSILRGTTTLSIKTFSIMTLGIMDSFATLNINDT